MNLDALKLDFQKPIHIIGIGGIGMSGLAKLLHQNNIKVQGSDINENTQTKELKKLGITVFANHAADNILGCSLVVKSSAIKNDNVEIKASKNKSIPVISRAELLSNMLLTGYNICITGAHGKTSTTSLVYSILKGANFDPTVICGGIINSIKSNVFKGSGSINVVEADESDGTFMILPTNISIITNIDSEHLDYYGSLQNIINIYKLFIEKALLKDLVIICDDCVGNKNFIKSDVLTKLAIHGRHNLCSSIICTQSYTKVPRVIRLQAQGLALFPSSQNECRLLCEDYCPPHKSKKDFNKIIDYATDEPFSFLYIQNHCADVKDRYRKKLGNIINID